MLNKLAEKRLISMIYSSIADFNKDQQVVPFWFYVLIIEINYSRLIMPLAMSRGILLRPRSERVETQLSLFVSM